MVGAGWRGVVARAASVDAASTPVWVAEDVETTTATVASTVGVGGASVTMGVPPPQATPVIDSISRITPQASKRFVNTFPPNNNYRSGSWCTTPIIPDVGLMLKVP